MVAAVASRHGPNGQPRQGRPPSKKPVCFPGPLIAAAVVFGLALCLQRGIWKKRTGYTSQDFFMRSPEYAQLIIHTITGVKSLEILPWPSGGSLCFW